MKHFKTLDDLIGTHVLVNHLSKPGYVWGGRPEKGIDTPDILYVTIEGSDWEIGAEQVSPIFVPDSIEKRFLFENIPGTDAGDEFEEEAS